MEVGGQGHNPVDLPAGKSTSIHCTRGWVRPRAGLGVNTKPPGFEPRTLQPVASRYMY